jgi:hypothetical protein
MRPHAGDSNHVERSIRSVSVSILLRQRSDFCARASLSGGLYSEAGVEVTVVLSFRKSLNGETFRKSTTSAFDDAAQSGTGWYELWSDKFRRET